MLRRQVGPRGVIHEIEPEARVRLPVAQAVEAAQGFQALLEHPGPPEAVHQVFLVIGQRAHQLHPVVPVEFRQVFLAGFQQDRQVGPGKDMGPSQVQALHQVFVMGVEFRSPPGEVHGGDGAALHHPDDRVDGVAFHLFRAVRSGQEMAVFTRLVAAPPQVDL